MELLGDIFENEDQYEEIEGIERPAEIAGDDGVALLRGERADIIVPPSESGGEAGKIRMPSKEGIARGWARSKL
ncbi:hypothetical protein K9B32_01560 [Rhizobium sp. 3T7]|uniref:hypothetical protein n=1 Tax=Rhizobium sp. 3T7 TaxID=2874922 RepID=UPI001CCD2F12|nr:hypothetical protein [Rhizobium sp. 3T7]MBZ9788819.1 hypothetical protein [Rhizobium sp. 3T7]